MEKTTRLDALLAELTHEATTTRKHLARLPDAHFDWRPHPKSFTAGDLARHIVDCIGWATATFAADLFEFNPATYAACKASSTAAMLEAFDAEVAKAQKAIADCTDDDATGLWRLTMPGKVFFEKPREAVFRDMALSHLVHHRGQFSVYLRLLDVPVPGSYGPTADD
jgi:uncharacterized damage-inducible protein DinB